MAYDVMTYIRLRDIQLLNQRFENLKPLVRVEMRREELVRRSMEDPEWGKAKLEEINAELEDLKQDMTNIVIAIECLKKGA